MAVGTTENTADSGSTPGSSSPATSASTSTSSAPMSALAAVEKAAGSLSSSDTAPGPTKPGDTAAAAGGTGTPGANPAATTQAQPTGQPDATGAKGPIPFDRHETAVKNARAEGQSAYLRSIVGTQQVTEQHHNDVKLGYSLVSDLRSNPKAFIENIARDLGLQIVDPRSATPAQGTVKPGQLPQADLVSEDGKRAYSAEMMMQVIDAKVKEAVEQVTGTIQPILADREAQQKASEQEAKEREALDRSGNFLVQMRQREHFKEYEPAILAKLKAMDPETKQSLGAFAALQTAYLDVIREIVQPKLAADADQQVRRDYAKKAATTGSVLPNGSQPTQERQRPRNVRELSKHLENALS